MCIPDFCSVSFCFFVVRLTSKRHVSLSSSARTTSTSLSVPTQDQVRSLLGDAQRDPGEATREKLNASIAVLPSVTHQSVDHGT